MPSEKILKRKQKIVAELAAEFKDAQAIVFTDFRGMTVEQDTQLRAALRKGDVEYKVVKNSISSRALAQAGYTGLEEILKGPIAIAYSKTDVVAPAKIIKEHTKKFNELEIKGGTMEGQLIDLAEINRLAAIPPIEVLYGQVVFSLVSPIAGLAILLNEISKKAEEQGVETVAEVVEATETDAEDSTTEMAEAAPEEAVAQAPAEAKTIEEAEVVAETAAKDAAQE